MSSVPFCPPACCAGVSGSTIHSSTGLAQAMGVSQQAVHKWLGREDWCFGPPPWSAETVQKIREWRKLTLRPVIGGVGAGPSLNALRLRRSRAMQKQQVHSLMLFARIGGELFPIHCSLPDGTEVLPDGRFTFSPEQASRLTGLSPVALRTFWANQIGGAEVSGVRVVR